MRFAEREKFHPLLNFKGLWLLQNPIPVWWGHISTLEADIKCMRHLTENDKHWEMFLNPAGSELPLRSVDNIRKALKETSKFGSAVDISPVPNGNKGRFELGHYMKR